MEALVLVLAQEVNKIGPVGFPLTLGFIMPIKQLLYLTLSIVGLVATWYFNFQFMAVTQATLTTFDLGQFLRDGFANPAASSLSADLFIGGAAASLFIVFEGRRLKIKRWWVYFIMTNIIAFAFAFPLFLMMRERHLDELEAVPSLAT